MVFEELMGKKKKKWLGIIGHDIGCKHIPLKLHTKFRFAFHTHKLTNIFLYNLNKYLYQFEKKGNIDNYTIEHNKRQFIQFL